MKIEDLKDDEIYVYMDTELLKYNKSHDCMPNVSINNNQYKPKDCWEFNCLDKGIRIATLVEKHWLNKCIEANKFISKEKALEDFNQLTDADGKSLIIGAKYTTKNNGLAYYAGISNKYYTPIFETINYDSENIDIIEELPGYICKGNGTFWRYSGLNKEFSLYEEPPIKVFDKFNIGQIVVVNPNPNSLGSKREGDIYKILPFSSKYRLVYEAGANSKDIDDWRAATSEEIEFYNNGGKNIKDMKQNLQLGIGKWYLFEDNWIGRFHHSVDDLIYCDYWITDKKEFKDVANHPLHSGRGVLVIKEVSLEEIQQYLPDNHPDKIKKEIKKEYVKLLKTDRYNWGKSSGEEKPIVGNIYKVKHFANDKLDLETKYGNWITLLYATEGEDYILVDSDMKRESNYDLLEKATNVGKSIQNWCDDIINNYPIIYGTDPYFKGISKEIKSISLNDDPQEDKIPVRKNIISNKSNRFTESIEIEYFNYL